MRRCKRNYKLGKHFTFSLLNILYISTHVHIYLLRYTTDPCFTRLFLNQCREFSTDGIVWMDYNVGLGASYSKMLLDWAIDLLLVNEQAADKSNKKGKNTVQAL